MSKRKIAALMVSFSLVAIAADATSRRNVQIKVLDSQTQALSTGDNGVPNDCNQQTFDAYCRSTTSTPLMHILLVQEDNGAPFRISCTQESKFSKCTPLEPGSSFDARKEKKGIIVYYADDKGKLKSQFYTFVAGAAVKPVMASVATPASSASSTVVPAEKPAQAQSAAAPAAPAQSEEQAPQVVAAPSSAGPTVKCSFTSTPAGAEVTVDGRYVGSTPSVLGVTTGTHVVVVSMAGFAQWKRDLTVEPGSVLSVNAVLQKSP